MGEEKKSARQLYVTDLKAMKARGRKIVLAAPWDYNSTRMAEEAAADVVVIGGGTAAMMLGGQPHALGASMEDMLSLTKKVAPAVKRAVLYVSLPYGSFHVSNEQAVRNAITLIKAGAHCVKAQAPGPLRDRAKSIIDAGIPFVGHVGLLPQLIYKRGGFRVFGKTFEEAADLYNECIELERLGACAIEMECVPAKVAAEIAGRVKIPVFGIGSGAGTDGQFVVLVDALGLQKTLQTKYSKRYVHLWPVCVEALKQAAEEVRTGAFPAEAHWFRVPEAEYGKFMEYLGS